MDTQGKILKTVPVKSHFGNLNIESSDPSSQMAPKWQNHVCGILCHYAIHFDTAWNINWNGKFETSQRRLPILENVRLYCNDTEICVSRNWHKTWVWAHVYASDCKWNVIYADNTAVVISNTVICVRETWIFLYGNHYPRFWAFYTSNSWLCDIFITIGKGTLVKGWWLGPFGQYIMLDIRSWIHYPILEYLVPCNACHYSPMLERQPMLRWCLIDTYHHNPRVFDLSKIEFVFDIWTSISIFTAFVLYIKHQIVYQ